MRCVAVREQTGVRPAHCSRQVLRRDQPRPLQQVARSAFWRVGTLLFYRPANQIVIKKIDLNVCTNALTWTTKFRRKGRAMRTFVVKMALLIENGFYDSSFEFKNFLD